MSLTNEWHEPELLLNTKPVICEATGFLISESQLDYKLATMISNDEIGSCHVIIKSAVISVTEYPKKSK
tara:strand:- start:272 stop:478 length:207 start_codon:yes stop_codon:yes gene_type:complete